MEDVGLNILERQTHRNNAIIDNEVLATPIPEYFFYLKGIIFSIENDLAIPNAEISLLKNQSSILANQAGEFEMTIPKKFLDDKIVISAMGFTNDTINIFDLVKLPKKIHRIWLQTQNFNQIALDGITVIANNIILTPEEIIKKARKNISVNYNQNPYNQKFVYNYLKSTNLGPVLGHKSVVETFNSAGMKRSGSPGKKLYGDVEHFKIIGKNKGLNIKEGKLGEMALIFNWDVILNKSSVLYKTKSYALYKEGVLDYNDKEVYKIRFVNKSTKGYKSVHGSIPIESSGLIYIDKANYAVLRYEHCIKREPFESKEYLGKIVEQSQKILYSYKQKQNKLHFISHGQLTDKTTLTEKNKDSIRKEYITKREILSIYYKDSNVSIIKQPLSSISTPINFQRSINFWKRNPFILQEIKLNLGLCM